VVKNHERVIFMGKYRRQIHEKGENEDNEKTQKRGSPMRI
jgi:hypothetical protein